MRNDGSITLVAYRGYMITGTPDSLRIYPSGSVELIDTAPSMEAAKKTIDEWHRAA